MQREAEAALQKRSTAPSAAPKPTIAVATPIARAPAPVIATLPARKPARVEAAIDWSSCSAPAYPALSVKRGEEGLLVIVADLDAQARVQDMHITQSSGHSRLDRVTLDAVRECRFTAATEDGAPRPATAEVRFTWKLQ